MKKALIALLAGLMIFGFCACGSSDDSEGTKTETVASDGEMTTTDTDEPRYTSDGELIVEEELPASDSEITE